MSNLVPGSPVIWQNADWVVFEITGLDEVVLRNAITGRLAVAPASELRTSAATAKLKNGLMAIGREDWSSATDKFAAIQPLLKSNGARSRAQVEELARQLGKGPATIYRWLKQWQKTGTVSSLVRAGRSDQGGGRLNDEVEAVVRDEIETYYLTKERPSTVNLHERVRIACRDKGLRPPGVRTLSRRIAALSGRLVMSQRESRKLAREAYEPIRGTFPGADVPLAVFQIDHSPIDVIFVDEVYRRPINRAFMTIVIDSCTRMIAGFCVTLDPPGALSTGLALLHAILPKDGWLKERAIDGSWPIQGLPAKIYADNAKEFRGTMLERACAEYGILMENRPKGLPNYGGHVERLFRTVMRRTHLIRGTTFSNVEERREYDSQGRAVMTLKEFETWFSIFCANVYNQSPHKGIGGVPPVKLYERAILGTDTQIGVGLPAPIADVQKLRLDFMPYVERTIQEYGVVIDNIHYYADVLRPWIHARDPVTSKGKRKFIFVRDPRDIGEVYFFDPEAKNYFPIPYRDRTHPRMSVWELRSVLSYLADHPGMQPDEDTIFDGLKHMRRIEEESAAKSLKARRNQQRRSDQDRASRVKAEAADNRPAPAPLLPVEDEEVFEPFDDIEQAP